MNKSTKPNILNCSHEAFGVRLALKIETLIPFVLVELAGAYKFFGAGMVAAVFLCLVGTWQENWLAKRAAGTGWLRVLCVTAMFPLFTYLVLIGFLSFQECIDDPLRSYGIGNTLFFLIAWVLVGRMGSFALEGILERRFPTRNPGGNEDV